MRQNRVRFQHLIRRPPRGDGSVFEKFDDLDGGQQSFGSRHAGEDFLRFDGGLQQRLHAAAPIQAALAGADQQRAHTKRVLGFDAFVGRRDPVDPRRAEGEKTAPQRSTKRADRQLGRLAKADDNGAGGPGAESSTMTLDPIGPG